MVAAPRIDPVDPGRLDDADGADIAAKTRNEGERYTDATLAGPLEDVVFEDCAFDGVVVDGAGLRRARLITVVLDRLAAAELAAPYSFWRDVRISGSRIGAAELFDADWDSVTVERSKLDFANLRGARLTDVVFEGCQLGELDLGGVTAQRVAFRDCRIGTLDVTGAHLVDVDLRTSELRALRGIDGLAGATIDTPQLAELAPLLAEAAGLSVED
jgi:uncharacterized protein YjbI with pentapeptide repeats